MLQVAQDTRLLGGDILRAFRVAQGHAQQFFHVRLANFGERHHPVLLIHLVIFRVELAHSLNGANIPLGFFRGRAGDDERGAGFIDQDVIDLIHDGIRMTALDAVIETGGQVIPQVVKAKFRVGAVGNIRLVGSLARHHHQLVLVFVRGFFGQIHQESVAAIFGAGSHLQYPDGQTEGVVDRRHPAGIAAGQVIIDGDQVGSQASQGVQVKRQGGYQRFAFAGAHLGDLALVQGHTANHLDVKMAQADGTLAGLAHHSKGFRQQVIQRFAFRQAGAEFVGLGAQRFIAQLLKFSFQRVDLCHN